ncbi:MAG: TIGR00282 family metallophosphoesterase [bacterium]|nr:TIGR00282 family metallophosphoesterase [bacterium]
MKILFVGDVYGKPGRRAAADLIPRIKAEHSVDFCIVNGENAAGGFGITENIGRKFHAYGADVITTGNHVWDQKESLPYIFSGDRILRPANFPPGVGGVGSGIFQTANGIPVGVACLQGRTNMKSLDCPFRAAREIVETLKKETPVIFIDFHAEATSEKIAFGWFMDGQASAVVGTHTHVQTADECILPGGTAYLTDAGMTGPHDSVIGAEKEPAIQRFLNQMPVRFEPASGDVKLCGALIDVDEKSGKALKIERLRINWQES